MIICPNCNHQNPEGSVQCESCYTPLPTTSPCPNCGAKVQTDATFCGQCGYNLQGSEIRMSAKVDESFEENPFEENSHPDSWEEDLILTSTETESFQSPWDVEENDDFSELEEENTVSFDNTEVLQSSASTFGSTNTNEEIEELPDNTEENEDIESWISSMTEESSQRNEEDLDLAISEPLESEELVFSAPESELADFPDPLESEELVFSAPESELADFPEFLSESPESVTPSAFSAPESELFEFAELSSESPESVTPNGSFVAESESLAREQEPETKDLAVSLESNSLETPITTNAFSEGSSMNIDTSTRLQLQRAILFHLQTGTNLEIAPSLAIVRIGKQNNQVPPDIDVSGFPNSEIVSRIHADIRVEGDTYFIEDRGSSNGTYVNHSPLMTGNRHRLRAGDRISLGKGDLMTFIFQLD